MLEMVIKKTRERRNFIIKKFTEQLKTTRTRHRQCFGFVITDGALVLSSVHISELALSFPFPVNYDVASIYNDAALNYYYRIIHFLHVVPCTPILWAYDHLKDCMCCHNALN